MVAGERNPKRGREGVYFAKRWLESTTRCQVPWTVEDADHLTTLSCLNGSEESWDLKGYFTDGERAEFYAEVKKRNDAGTQYSEYPKYLADCYSATKFMLDNGVDKKWEFMWITWHPFSLDKWKVLCSPEYLNDALTKYPAMLGVQEIDAPTVQLVASRLWLVVLSDKHEKLMMSDRYLGHIRSLATQAGGT
jgi:hypothetical protein